MACDELFLTLLCAINIVFNKPNILNILIFNFKDDTIFSFS